MIMINNYDNKNKKVYAYGARAKVTKLMCYFRLELSIIDTIINDRSLKQGILSLGLQILVAFSEILKSNKSYVIIILAWNFAKSIIKKNKDFINSGGTLIFPLPEIKEIKKND